MDFNHEEEHVDDSMIIVQANLDDMNPEFCSHVMDLLFVAGANDVYWIPIIMKKGRPGLMLNVLVSELRLEAIESVIFKETTSIGIRYTSASCHRLGREFIDVSTPWGKISVKVAYHQGNIVQYAPEFKDCEQAAKQYNIPLKQVYDEVRKTYLIDRQKESN